MKCPHCQTEFDLSWPLYIKSGFGFGHFQAPCCDGGVKEKSSILKKIFLFFLGYNVGIASAYIIWNENNLVIKSLAILVPTLLIFLDKYYNSRLNLLTTRHLGYGKKLALGMLYVVIGFSTMPLILEKMTEPNAKIYYKVLSYCDFASDRILLPYPIYKYWQFRDVQPVYIEDKDLLVETILLVTVHDDKGCNIAAKKELDKIAAQGYEFSKYRNSSGWPWIMREVLGGYPVAVEWILDLDGFVNTKLIKESSPYNGQDIFELAESLYKLDPTPSRKTIIQLLEPLRD